MSNYLEEKRIGLLLGPVFMLVLLLAPLPFSLQPEGQRTIAIAVLMLTWWVTEAVPLPVTALIPLVGIPLLRIDTIAAAATPYGSPVIFLFMGGFMIALALEKWNLHRRVALHIVRFTGTHANGIVLGFMLATALLSMWISNTATTIMMLPIALSVVGLLQREQAPDSSTGMRTFSLSLMLGIAYAANIGGTATIVGTPPNVVFVGIMREKFQQEISFANWMLIGAPFALVLLAISYALIVLVLYPNRLGAFSGARTLIDNELAKLGPVSIPEKRTLAVFLLTAVLWILRAQINRWVPDLNLTDPGIAILGTLCLFIVPVDWPKYQFLLDWEDTRRLPWGILLLFGGGLSLAGALDRTGLISMIGAQFESLQQADLLLLFGLTAVSLFLTEIISNVALVTVFLPVVGAIALGLGVDPVWFGIPVTLAASCAFMLPMSTPPNAIVFASGHLTVGQMVRAGIWLNLVAILWISLISYWIVPLLFK